MWRLSLIIVSLFTSSLSAGPLVVRPVRVVPIPVKNGTVVIRDQNFRAIGSVNTGNGISTIRGLNGINEGSVRDGVIRDAKGQIIGVAK